MPKKNFLHSILLHLCLGALLCIFVFNQDSIKPGPEPIEIQLTDVHVHKAESPTQLPPKHSHVNSDHFPEPALRKEVPSAPSKVSLERNSQPSPSTENSAAAQSNISQASAQNEYLSALQKLIAAHRYYPKSSLMNEEEGTVQLKVSLDATGKIIRCEVAKGSGFARLDEAGQKTLNDIGTLPLPKTHSGPVVILIPIRFELNPHHS